MHTKFNIYVRFIAMDSLLSSVEEIDIPRTRLNELQVYLP